MSPPLGYAATSSVRAGGPPASSARWRRLRNGDAVIDLANDIFGVILHYAPSGLGPEYDVLYDPGPTAGPNPWNMTAPDGVIDLGNDILGVIQQYVHDCRLVSQDSLLRGVAARFSSHLTLKP